MPLSSAELPCEEGDADIGRRSLRRVLSISVQDRNEGATFEVEFVDTDDPLLYDKVDRIGTKIEVEEEVAYDDAVAAGTTNTGIEAWVSARRAVELRGTA